MRCHFYGKRLMEFPSEQLISIPTGGNQCALIDRAHALCVLEVESGEPANWQTCPFNPRVNGTYTDPVERFGFPQAIADAERGRA